MDIIRSIEHEHLKEKRQAKILESLRKQVISCREQGITREKILHCVDNVYQDGRDSGRTSMPREEREEGQKGAVPND